MDNVRLMYILLFIAIIFVLFDVLGSREKFTSEQCHIPDGIDTNCNNDFVSGNSVITNAHIDYDNKYNNKIKCCSNNSIRTGTNFLPNVNKIYPYEVDCQSKQALLSYYNTNYGDIYNECRKSDKPLTCREIAIPCSTNREVDFNCEGDEAIGKISVDECSKSGHRSYKYTCCKPQ